MSYVLYVLIEAPLEALERIMFPNRRSPPAAKDQLHIESRTEVVDQMDQMDQMDHMDGMDQVVQHEKRSDTQPDLETSANKTETDLELSN